MTEPTEAPALLALFVRHGLGSSFTECWEWKGYCGRGGYGSISGRVDGHPTTLRAHVFSYRLFRGPVPDALELDHLCRNPSCVQPLHLEAVTHAENMRRAVMPRGADHFHGSKTHCPKGHPYDEANTYWRTEGGKRRRGCLACRAAVNTTVTLLASKWGPIIRAARLERGLTQSALARLASVSGGLLGRVEKGNYPLGGEKLEQILDAIPEARALGEQVAA